MPRYYFNVFDGVDLIEALSSELADLQAARKEAARLSSECMQDGTISGALTENWRMEVTDSKVELLFRLLFMIEIVEPRPAEAKAGR